MNELENSKHVEFKTVLTYTPFDGGKGYIIQIVPKNKD